MTPTLLLAGAATGLSTNPTHSFFQIFSSFEWGREAGNIPDAPYQQVFYSKPFLKVGTLGSYIQPIFFFALSPAHICTHASPVCEWKTCHRCDRLYAPAVRLAAVIRVSLC
jgi:hypothetical protein